MIEYAKTIGLNSNQPRGRGFNYPYDTALGTNGRIYVLNRMYPQSTEGIRIQICDIYDEWYGEFGNGPAYGREDFLVPVAMAFDNENRLYVTDESLSQVKIFDIEGNFLDTWGKGNRKAESIRAPSGVCVDRDNTVLVVEQNRSCVTKIDTKGNIISRFGCPGDGEGEFDLPWGITTDRMGNIYVADWRNDRIQKFDPKGEFLMQIGDSGSRPGQLNRPSSVAVDTGGQIYVADWGNERVQVFDCDGTPTNVLEGEATLSKWAIEWLDANQDEFDARKASNLKVKDIPGHLDSPYHVSSQTEHLFWGPVSVKLDPQGLLYVTEHGRHRIQIYQTETEDAINKTQLNIS